MNIFSATSALVIVALTGCGPAPAEPVIDEPSSPLVVATQPPATVTPEQYVVTAAPVPVPIEPVIPDVPTEPEPAMPTVAAEDTLALPADGGMVDPASIMAALATPCAQEDSTNCFWRADLRGNGIGDSFVNIEGHLFPLSSVLAG